VSDFVYTQWGLLLAVGLTLTAVFVTVAVVLHHRNHRHFTDPKNWGALLAATTVAVLYALLHWVETLADVRGAGPEGERTREWVGFWLFAVQAVALTVAGIAGLTLLNRRERLEVEHNPSVPAKYPYLFGGFDGEYFLGFAAPFQVEGEWHRRGPTGVCSDLAREQLLRFSRLQNEAIYIFHTAGDFQRALDFFQNGVFPFVAQVLQHPRLQERANRPAKVVLYEPLDDVPSHQNVYSYSFFLGTRKGQPCCILYPASSFTSTRQPQRAVLVHNDKEFYDLLVAYFWEQHRRIQLGDLRNGYRRHVWNPAANRFVVDDPVAGGGNPPVP